MPMHIDLGGGATPAAAPSAAAAAVAAAAAAAAAAAGIARTASRDAGVEDSDVRAPKESVPAPGASLAEVLEAD